MTRNIKKVILINPINYGRDSFRVPLGLLTIATIFSENNVEVQWIDADALRNNKEQIEGKILQNLDADLIAMGGLHSSYKYIKELFVFLALNKIQIPKLVGGRIAQTIDHLLWNKVPGVDMICKQEGENTVHSLCKHFPNMEKIDGIEYRKDDKIIKNKPAPLINSLDELPELRWDFLDEKCYFSRGIGYILSSRGCPYSCKFCKYPDSNVKQRILSNNRILNDIKELIKNYRVHTICFLDEFFLLNKSRVSSFCDALEKENIKIDWIISSRANAIKEKDIPLLKRMRNLGCTHINMGIESGSQIMLDMMNKNLKVDQVETAVNVIRNSSIHLKASFIFGYPGETRETAIESAKWRIKMKLKGKYFYATPYPGAPLYEYFIEKYQLDEDKEEEWILKSASLKDLSINLTDMTQEQLYTLDNECKLLLKSHKRIFRNILVKSIPNKILNNTKILLNNFKKDRNG